MKHNALAKLARNEVEIKKLNFVAQFVRLVIFLITWRKNMLAFLIDENGVMVEQLENIPICLTADQLERGHWNLPIKGSRPSHAYDIVCVKISTFISENTEQRCLAFIDKSSHQAILDYMSAKT